MRIVGFCFGSTILYWDTILLALALLACALAFRAAYGANGGRVWTALLFVPLAAALALVLARLLYYGCHPEQFGSLAAALTRFEAGGLCLSGTVLGFTLAALLLRPRGGAALLLDCAAPGLALGLAIVRLSALFNGSCRGKAVLSDPRLQRLPFAVRDAAADGGTEYRFAAFFLGALLFFAFFLLLLARFARLYSDRRAPRGRSGDVFLSFLLLYSAEELLIDSMRNDANYFLFNAFISVAQIFAALTLLVVLIVYSRRAIRARGLRWLFVWLGWALGLAAVGVCEYLVQRHGNWQLSCYTLMSAAIALMLLCTALMRRAAEKAEAPASAQSPPPGGPD